MFKRMLLFLYFTILSILVLPVHPEGPPVRLPELQHLSYRPDTIGIDSSVIASSDSAVIISPKIRTLLDSQPVTIEVIPRCRIDSMYIVVHHSYNTTDTIAHCTAPPYRAVWNFSSVSDQDQIHLQFGYVLFHPSGKLIISTPQPHNWAIDRNFQKKRKKYHSKQILSPDTVIIDGKLDDWKHAARGKCGSIGTFSIIWSDAVLYFSAKITSDNILPTDCVELHLDPFRTRTTFADHRHRSIRFSPMSRSYCFVSHKKNDPTYSQCDSIAALLSEGMIWRVTLYDTGYVIEAALPFYALSDLDFPLLTFGLDVTCFTGKSTFVSWAGSNTNNRYNPSEWGTIALHQAMLPLKIAVFIFVLVLVLLFLLITIKVLHHLFVSEHIEKMELSGGSPLLQRIHTCIDQHLSEPDLTLEKVATLCEVTGSVVVRTLSDELECTFDSYLDVRRLDSAKRKLWNASITIDAVANECGFLSISDLEEKFRFYLHTSPDRFRNQISEMRDDSETTNDTGHHKETAITS